LRAESTVARDGGNRRVQSSAMPVASPHDVYAHAGRQQVSRQDNTSASAMSDSARIRISLARRIMEFDHYECAIAAQTTQII
jgi:hypothetical protein